MVSAVTINYGGFDDTERCVKSLQKAYAFDRIVIVDNPVAENDARLADLKGPHVQIIYNDDNVGFGHANNIGIRWILDNTASDYIFLINNDAEVKEDTINRLLDEAEEDTGILTPKILFDHDRETIWYAGAVMDWKRGVPHIENFKQKNKGDAESPRRVTFASGCAMLVKRTLLEKIGGFDERYFMYEEDIDFCLRALGEGFNIKYVPRSLMYHKVNASVGNQRNVGPFHPQNEQLLFFITHRVQNRIINIMAHAGFADKMKFLFFFTAMSTVKNMHYLLRGRFDAIGTYFTAIGNGLAKGWDKRKNNNKPVISKNSR